MTLKGKKARPLRAARASGIVAHCQAVDTPDNSSPIATIQARTLARRLRLPPAVAIVVAELAFAKPVTWVGAQQ